MKELDYLELSESIKQVFTHDDDYRFDKYVAEFKVNSEYVGDVFNMNIFEPRGDEAPIFYHTYSPYDTITKKAPDHAAIFRDGRLVYASEITTYTSQRTGVMSSVVLMGLGVESLADKRILFVGAGRIATCDLSSIKSHYPEVNRVDYVNTGSKLEAFASKAQELDIQISKGDLVEIDKYDLIICHTNAAKPVLTAEMQKHVKEGTIITTFVSENFQEVAPEYYNADQANVIIDWDQTIVDSPDLNTAVDNKLIEDTGIIRLKDLLSGDVEPQPKKYTIYRSHGTPMQNLAFLKLLYTD